MHAKDMSRLPRPSKRPAVELWTAIARQGVVPEAGRDGIRELARARPSRSRRTRLRRARPNMDSGGQAVRGRTRTASVHERLEHVLEDQLRNLRAPRAIQIRPALHKRAYHDPRVEQHQGVDEAEQARARVAAACLGPHRLYLGVACLYSPPQGVMGHIGPRGIGGKADVPET